VVTTSTHLAALLLAKYNVSLTGSRRLSGAMKREAGVNPAQGRCCMRSEIRVFFVTVTAVMGRPPATRYEP